MDKRILSISQLTEKIEYLQQPQNLTVASGLPILYRQSALALLYVERYPYVLIGRDGV